MTAIDVASEIFAITDVLSSQPMLRRSLSEPSASAEQRRELAQKLFGGRVGGEAMHVLSEVVGKSWGKPDLLVRGLEREGVVSAFRGAEAEGQLERVTSELHALGRAAKENGELTAVLRDPSYEFDAKRSLVDRLLGEGAHPVTHGLAARAINGHKRTFPLTIDAYLDIAAEINDVTVARVTVAKPLDQGRVERLRNALSTRLGRPVQLQINVDPDVLGGMQVEIGHEVYESTVAGRLEEVRRQLINS